MVAIGRAQRQTGQAQHRQDVGVVPLEGDREGEHVEVVERGLRLEGDEPRILLDQRLQLLLGGQEHPLADRVGVIVEEPVDGLEAEVGHPHEIRVGEGQPDPHAVDVRLSARIPPHGPGSVARRRAGASGLHRAEIRRSPPCQCTARGRCRPESGRGLFVLAAQERRHLELHRQVDFAGLEALRRCRRRRQPAAAADLDGRPPRDRDAHQRRRRVDRMRAGPGPQVRAQFERSTGVELGETGNVRGRPS